jgi:hypothetical protein
MGFDCWTEENGYTEKDRWPVRQNCRKTCNTCEGKGTFGMPWPTVIDAIDGPMFVPRGGSAGTALNTAMFIQVYKEMFTRGTYRKHDLVVKLDPDTVFSANRLRALFADQDLREPILFQNSRFLMGHYSENETALHGPIMAVTKTAIERYRKNFATCDPALHPERYNVSSMGEDWYIATCLRDLGVAIRYKEKQLLETRYIAEPADMHCAYPEVAAFHPYKSTKAFMQCWTEIRLAEMTRTGAGSCRTEPGVHGNSWFDLIATPEYPKPFLD